jgi:hypothetical protein
VDPSLFLLIPAAAIAGVAVANTLRERARVKGLVEGLRVDDDVEIIAGVRNTMEITTRRPHRVAKLASNGVAWDGTTEATFAGAVTWIYLTRWPHQDSFLVGDAAIDSIVAVSGALPDIVRAVLVDARVKAAVTRLFIHCRATALHLDADGRLLVRFVRTARPADAKAQLLTLAELGDALEQTPAARALPHPKLAEIEALGGASGAPIGVPGRR